MKHRPSSVRRERRIDPFANLKEPLPSFTTKARTDKPVAKETIERIAEENNFPSRQAKAPTAQYRKPRVYRTGRNQQFNAKATPETIERFYKQANERNVPLGELLKLALDALEAAASPVKRPSSSDWNSALRSGLDARACCQVSIRERASRAADSRCFKFDALKLRPVCHWF